jgi:hypothetical protein
LVLVALCHAMQERRNELLDIVTKMASTGLRTLCLSYRGATLLVLLRCLLLLLLQLLLLLC